MQCTGLEKSVVVFYSVEESSEVDHCAKECSEVLLCCVCTAVEHSEVAVQCGVVSHSAVQ